MDSYSSEGIVFVRMSGVYEISSVLAWSTIDPSSLEWCVQSPMAPILHATKCFCVGINRATVSTIVLSLGYSSVKPRLGLGILPCNS